MSIDIDIKTITVFGIADCYGIESMLEKNDKNEKEIGLLNIRAMSNRHRHAVLYEADLTEDVYADLNSLLKAGEFTDALQHLKTHAVEIRSVPSQKKSWDLIPNPKLDPWG